jgi:predicted lipid carrier protein YhbT
MIISIDRALPWFLMPLRLAPEQLTARVLPIVLHHMLADALEDGELDILEGRTMRLDVTDAGVVFGFTLVNQRIQTTDTERADVSIRGDAAAFLALAGGSADPDMLFFRRRLSVEGDVALGLSIKNLLESYEPRQHLPTPLRYALEAAAARVKV